MATAKGAFAIFARVSTYNQLGGHSLQIQERDGRAYVKKLGGTVVKVYKGQESATGQDRRDLEDALREAGTIYSDLVVQDPSRLSRNPAIMFEAMTRLAKAGVRLHDFSGPMPFDTPEGEFRLMMESVVGRYSAQLGVRKSIVARVSRLESGHIAAGRPPWGRRWLKQEKRFEIIPERRAQIKKAYELIVTRSLSLNKAALALGMATSSLRKAITQAPLTTIEQNLEGRTFKFPCPSLLSGTNAAQIRRRLSLNAVIRPTVKGKYLLQGLVRCGCGATMSGQTSVKSGDSSRIYRHPPATYKRDAGCCWQVPVDRLDFDVFACCAESIKDGTSLKEAIENSVASEATSRRGLERTLRQTRKEVLDAQNDLDELVDVLKKLPKEGQASARTQRRIRSTEQTLTDKQAELSSLQSKIAVLDQPVSAATEIAAKLRNLAGIARPLKEPSFEQKRDFVRVMVGRARRDSPAGIYIKMIRRKKKPKGVFWQYDLRGEILLASNDLVRSEDVTYAPDIHKIRTPSPQTLRTMATVVRSVELPRLKNTTIPPQRAVQLRMKST